MSSDQSDKPDDYQVGYGHPPTHTRFQKGKSGNPGGRPKGSASLRRLIQEEGEAEITLHERGKVRRITKSKAVVKRLYQQSLKGSISATKLLLDNVREEASPGPDGTPYKITSEDLACLENRAEFLTLIEAAKKEASQQEEETDVQD